MLLYCGGDGAGCGAASGPEAGCNHFRLGRSLRRKCRIYFDFVEPSRL